MKKNIILLVILLITSKAFAVSYTGTTPKDLADVTGINAGQVVNPIELCLPDEISDSIREIKVIEVADHKITPITGTYSVRGTDAVILGSSTSSYTVTLISPSSVGTTTIGKWLALKNIGSANMIVSGSVTNSLSEVAGTTTLSTGKVLKLFADDTRWYKDNSELDTFTTTTGTITTFYSTTGSITTLYSGTGIFSNYLTVPNLNVTSGLTTGTMSTSGAATIGGNLTVNGVTGLVDGDIPNGITLDNITQVTTRNFSSMQGTVDLTSQVSGTLSVTNVPQVFVNKWRVGATEGTGTLNFVAGAGVGLSPTFSTNEGTITVTAVGTATAAGWLDTGTQTISTLGYPVTVQGTLSVSSQFGISGLLDRDIPNTITLDNITQITTRNYNDITGTSSISPTDATITNATVTTFTATTGSITTLNANSLTIPGTFTVGGIVADNITGTCSAFIHARREATQSLNVSTWTTIPFDATSTAYNISHTVNTGTITVSRRGKYLANGFVNIRMANGAAGLRLLVNNSMIATGTVHHGYFNTGDGNTGGNISFNTILDLQANDTVLMQICYDAADNPKTILDANWASGAMGTSTGKSLADLTLVKIAP